MDVVKRKTDIYDLLQLAINTKELDLFLMRAGIYSTTDSMYDNPITGEESEIGAIYRYTAEHNCEVEMRSMITNVIIDWLKLQSGSGLYYAFRTLAAMKMCEKLGTATFEMNTNFFLNQISMAANLHKAKLLSIPGGKGKELWKALRYQNGYYYRKYGFLIIDFASEEEQKLLTDHFEKTYRFMHISLIEKAVAKLSSRDDLLQEAVHWVRNRQYIGEAVAMRVEGFKAEDIAEKTGKDAMATFSVLFKLIYEPKQTLEELRTCENRKVKQRRFSRVDKKDEILDRYMKFTGSDQKNVLHESPRKTAERYVCENYGYSEYAAKGRLDQIFRQPEVAEEWVNFILTGHPQKEDGSKVEVYGFTAEKLEREFNLSPLNAYCSLAAMAEDPDPEEVKTKLIKGESIAC